ncbi:glycoside hydrolase family 27 protein [Novipirellula artificiosorum]|uniref:Alpha-galactosidase n=1 Tax=Novipirellula artificiosorum TaxID=2528016 RepID=A0A5C6DHA8_9BACT|nr:glycoside hydrolase family 27 protein [Novipirellula artificiosorum]TWU34339.1 Alpha-galactosidase A precursor [Novipirellula artificiosorum]
MSLRDFAATPPMGWNSWDCFGVSVTEEDVRQNAEFMAKHLKQLGWQYVVVDLCWFAPDARTDTYKTFGLDQRIDDYGRLIPDPKKFPSSAGGAGFKPLADYVHRLGLKFGIHIMRGLPWQAADRKSPIKNSTETAADVAVPTDVCLWYPNMYGINMTRPGGQAYYDSLAELYASWDVDFIKADDMNSWDGEGNKEPYHTDEIEGLAAAIAKTQRPIALSLSPGAARICNANHLRRHANMWRISFDFWDDWSALEKQFDRCAAWAPYVTAGHWPDADMLPLGRVGIRGEVGEPRFTNFTEAEQFTLMTLWCIFRSPLMFGGHLPESDPLSLRLISNPEVIAVNQQSLNNHQVARDDAHVVWIADDAATSDKYLALFNLTETDLDVEFEFSAENLSGNHRVRDLWSGTDLGEHSDRFSMEIPSHGAGLYRLIRVPL